MQVSPEADTEQEEATFTSTEAKYIVHRFLSLVSEGFLVMVDLHTEAALRFWFMTGTPSHGHEGMVILRREDHPHIQYWPSE